MGFWRGVKRRVKSSAPPMLFLAVVGYFAWNAVNGDRGLKAMAGRQEVLKAAQAEQKQAENDRDTWERRIAGLRPAHLDPDTLDERARAMLNMAEPTDVVVMYAKDKRVF